MDIESVNAALDTRFDPAEAVITERMLREHAGTIPDAQLIEEYWVGDCGTPPQTPTLMGL